MDAEVIDARAGAEGETYANIGESIREQVYQIKCLLAQSSLLTNLDIGEVEKGYIDSNGNLVDSDYTLRTKNFLELSKLECFLVNADSKHHNIRIFRYSQDGVFEDEYLNADSYRLDLNKKYKISFSFIESRLLNVNDITKFNLLTYKKVAEITPEMFGAKANDETFNNSSSFYMMIEYCKSIAPLVDFEGRPVYDFKGITFKFAGTYSLVGYIYFPDMLNGVFDGLRLKQIGEEDSYLLNLGYARDCRFSNMILDGDYKSSCILLRDGYSNIQNYIY